MAALLLAACTTPPAPPAAPEPAPQAPQRPSVVPVEAEPTAPATQMAAMLSRTQGPLSSMLAYADRLRTLPAPELSGEIARLGEAGDSPTQQMQLALALAQTRSSADLARAAGLMQRVAANNTAEALPLQPLARLLAARYVEQRRAEDDRDKQAQQLRDSQRRIDQLNDRIEALRAIERSFSRPAHPAAPASRPQP